MNFLLNAKISLIFNTICEHMASIRTQHDLLYPLSFKEFPVSFERRKRTVIYGYDELAFCRQLDLIQKDLNSMNQPTFTLHWGIKSM